MNALVSNVRQFILNGAKGISKIVHKLPVFVRWASKLLVAHNLTAVPTDKDGVFVVVNTREVQRMLLHEFNKPFYRPVGPGNLEGSIVSVKRCFLCCA